MGRTKRRRLRKRQNIMQLNNSDVIKLVTWMTKNGWDNDGLKIAEFPGTGRGVLARKTFQPGDVLIEIPFHLMISYIVLKESENFKTFLNGCKVKLTILDLLALFLVEEFQKRDSFWCYYLKTLPKMQDLRMLWLSTEDELHEVNPEVSNALRKELDQFNQSWLRVQYLCSNVENLLTRDLYTWCYIIVNTRSVYVDPSKIRDISNSSLDHLLLDEPNMALCPFLDMFNHDSKASTTVALLRRNQTLKYVLTNNRKFKKYEQIFISYGDHNNLKLLCQYGFVLPENRNDTVNFLFPEILSILKLNANNRQYRFLCDRHLDQNLFVSYDSCSFNLASVLYVLTHDYVKDWTIQVYSSNYTTKEKYVIDNVFRLLVFKMKIYQKEFNDKKQKVESYSRHFQLYVEYLESRLRCLENLLRQNQFYKKELKDVEL